MVDDDTPDRSTASDEDGGRPFHRSTGDWIPTFPRRPVLKGVLLSAATASGVSLSSSRAAAAVNSITNESLTLFYRTAENIGTFTLQTADGRDLLFGGGNPRTSYLTVQVDGTNYVTRSGVSNATLLDSHVSQPPTVSEAGRSVATEWTLPEGVVVMQTLSLMGEAVEFAVSVENASDLERTINLRYLFDYQVDQQDGAPIFVDGEVLTTETRFESPAFTTWQTYDRLPEPNLTGRATVGTQPDQIDFVEWEDAFRNPYEYVHSGEPEGDSGDEFYTPGENNSPASDSAGLIFWNFGPLLGDEFVSVATYYGGDSPDRTRLGSIKTALDEYHDAIKRLSEETIRSKAQANARIFREHGLEYAENLVNYFGYRGEVSGIGPPDVDDETRLHLDRLLKDVSAETARQLHAFYDEMFNAANSDDPMDAIAETFGQFFRGNHPDQSQFLTVDGKTLEEFNEEFDEAFETLRDNFLAKLQARGRRPNQVNEIVRAFEKLTERVNEHRQRIASNNNALSTAVVEGREIKGQFGSIEMDNPGLILFSSFVIASAAAAGIAYTLTYGAYLVSTTAVPIAVTSVGVLHQTLSSWKVVLSSEVLWAWTVAGGQGTPQWKVKEVQEEALKKVMRKAWELGWEVGELAAQRVEVVETSVEFVTVDDVITREGARVAMETATIRLRNPHANMTITPRFVAKECYITSVNTDSPPSEHFGQVLVPPADEIPELEPGEETTVEVRYLVPLDITTGFYTLRLTVEANVFAVAETTVLPTFHANIDANEELVNSRLSEETITEGSSSSTTHDPRTESEHVTYGLPYGGSDLDIHLYDEAGNHVGIDYDTGEIDRQIPDTAYSGADRGRGYEWIRVWEPSGTFRVETVAVETDERGTSYVVDALETPTLPPTLRGYPSPVLIEGTPGQTVRTQLILAEIGGFSGSTGSLAVSDLTRDESMTIPPDAISFDDEFAVDPGGITNVEVAIDVPGDAAPGTYTGTITVTAQNTSEEVAVQLHVERVTRGGTLEVLARQEPDFDYRITVDGDVSGTRTGRVAADDDDRIVAHDDGTTTVLGSTGDREGDAFTVDGSVVVFLPAGGPDYELLLDGVDVTDELSWDASTFEIIAEQEADFDYRFTVEGEVWKTVTPDYAADDEELIVVSEDGITLVTGSTGGRSGDVFTVGGSITSFEAAEGAEYRLRLDGEVVDADTLPG